MAASFDRMRERIAFAEAPKLSANSQGGRHVAVPFFLRRAQLEKEATPKVP
jgi:hypothetical protein